MKKYLEHIVDSFTDYEGKAHHFVIVAISETAPKTAIEAYKDEWEGEDKNVSYHIAEEIEGEPSLYLQDEIVKVLKLGIAICNPNDVFNEELGIKVATYRAQPKLYATDSGVINSTMVKALLQQEASYIKNNPEKYITAYAENREKFLKNQELENIKNSFSEEEVAIVDKISNGDLDKVLDYCRKCGKI